MRVFGPGGGFQLPSENRDIASRRAPLGADQGFSLEIGRRHGVEPASNEYEVNPGSNGTSNAAQIQALLTLNSRAIHELVKACGIEGVSGAGTTGGQNSRHHRPPAREQTPEEQWGNGSLKDFSLPSRDQLILPAHLKSGDLLSDLVQNAMILGAVRTVMDSISRTGRTLDGIEAKDLEAMWQRAYNMEVLQLQARCATLRNIRAG